MESHEQSDLIICWTTITAGDKMKRVWQRPYIYWVIGIFLLYLGINIYLSDFYELIRFMPFYLDQIHWVKLILGVVFSLAISSLVAINAVYGYIRYKEHKKIPKAEIVTCVGAIGGLATGVCSVCIVSVFPFILGLFGITFSWISLPFQGLEIQALIIVLLSLSLWWMRK
jgi:hypothetical protein